MSAERWMRLAGELAAAGIETKVHERPYSEAVRGRVQHGVSRSIVIRRGDGMLVEIHDRWWAKNSDVWIGWTVTLSDRQSIVRMERRGLKRRADAVLAVLEVLS